MPAIIPKSPESILELRHKLEDELGDLRYEIGVATRNLTYAFGDQIPSTTDIEHIAQTTFVRPLNDLQKKLKHPGKDFLENLLSRESIIASPVALTASILGQAPEIPNIATAACTSLWASAAVTWRENRKMKRENPRLTFLLNAAR
ncbi:MAG: hypothetical protein LC641_07625 [Spirochaeta sp.]|nr:hypothetical protein [Spirochaeta sp.]